MAAEYGGTGTTGHGVQAAGLQGDEAVRRHAIQS